MQEDPLQEEMATHSSILTWRIPWTENPGRLQYMGSQRVMDCSLPGTSVHGILQARVLEWVAISSCRGSSWPRDWTRVSCNAGIFFTIWATRDYLVVVSIIANKTQTKHNSQVEANNFYSQLAFTLLISVLSVLTSISYVHQKGHQEICSTSHTNSFRGCGL